MANVTIYQASVWHVTSNSDTNEGRGQTVTLGYFLNVGAAQACASGAGVQGTDARIEQITALVVRDKDLAGGVYLLGEEVKSTYTSDVKLREQALAKLTTLERRALGF